MARVPERWPLTFPTATVSVGDAIREVAEILESGGVERARAEARDIVAVALMRPRLWPAVNKDAPMSLDRMERARAAAEKRAAGAPFAYAVGQAPFRHLTLEVNEEVLIPRQETEMLVQLVLDRTGAADGGAAVDVGTGSGAIALALASEGSFERVIATDVSAGALEVAAKNVRAMQAELTCPVELRCGSFLAPIRESGLAAVVSNPPYISFDEAAVVEPSVRDWEPPLALFSAAEGTRALRRIVSGSAERLKTGGLLALEVDSRRASIAAEIVMSNGGFRDVRVELDLAGRERFVIATKER